MKATTDFAMRWLLPPVIVVAALAVAWNMFHRPPQQAEATPPPPPPKVRTVTIAEHQGPLELIVDGIAVPFREFDLAAEVAGKIIEKAEACRAGKYVPAGTVLFRIDPTDYQLDVERLTFQVEQSTSNVEELRVQQANTEQLLEVAQADLELQQKEVKRLEHLYADASYVTESDLDRARQAELAARNAVLTLENELRRLQTRLGGAESALKLAKTQLAQSEADLARTTITAPVDAVVVADVVERDEYVQAGQTLVTLEDTSDVEIKCNLRMDQLYWLWSGRVPSDQAISAVQRYEIPQTEATVEYEMANLPGVHFVWSGQLARYDGIGLDEKTRMVPCRVVVDDPLDVRCEGPDAQAAQQAGPTALVRGMYVTVRIRVPAVGRFLRVPEIAVQPGKQLWVVRDGRLHIVDRLALVERVDRLDQDVPFQGDTGQVWIVRSQEDLATGARVIVSPLAAPWEGMPVEEVNES